MNPTNLETTPAVESDSRSFSASIESSSPIETTTNEYSDDSVFDGENEEEDFSSSSSEKSLNCLVEEDLENKKRLLHRQAKRLLRKNKRLRKNYALTNENIITKTAPATAAVRKSSRRRMTSKKLADSDYAMDDELSDSCNSESSEQSLVKLVVQPVELTSTSEASKGEIKLRIKRITTNSAVVQNESCLISPDARITRRTAAILKNSPTLQRSFQQQTAANDDEPDLLDDLKLNFENVNEIEKSREMAIPKSVKTLAEIRKQIFNNNHNKKRTSDEMSANSSGSLQGELIEIILLFIFQKLLQNLDK